MKGIINMLKETQSKLLHSILHEVRISIISQLLLGEKNIADLVKKVKIERSKVCYHLSILENEKMLKSRYVILKEAHSKGRAGKVYSINKDKFRKIKEAIEDFKKEVYELGS